MSQISEPDTVEAAVDLLADGAVVLAGGTWVMREKARRPHYVSLQRLEGLRAIERAGGDIGIGALATHTDIGAIESGIGPLGALAEAARRSAFPAVRNVATLGGNLAAPFPEEHGGLGQGLTETMIVAEAFGRALALEPYLATVVLAGGALRHAGNAALLRELVATLAAGQLTLALAHQERQARYDLADTAPPRAPTARAATRWRARRSWSVPATAPTS